MKKEEVHEHKDNSFGVSSVIFSVLSVLLSTTPIQGIVLAILGLALARKQSKHLKNKWSKAGCILSIIGLILSIVFWIVYTWMIRNGNIPNFSNI
ncbi:MAG: hypothetical protein AABY10_00475 [Nanoarchaeota archaeon]